MNLLAVSSVLWLSALGFFGPVGVVSVPLESSTQVGTLGLTLEDSRWGVGTLDLELEDSQPGVGTLSLELEDSAPIGVGSLLLELEDSPHSRAPRRSRPQYRYRDTTGSLQLNLE